jgi:NADPH:quinone reductase-like Zn-dependent oxidoreductase
MNNNDTMNAVIIRQYGGDEVLEYTAVPKPTPGPGEVLVKIHAAGLNYYDVKIRSGWLHRFFPLRFPHILGNDFAGEVTAVGENVSDYRPGDKVYGMITAFHGGTYAEYLAVPADLIRRAPANMSYEEAAALPMVYLTAWIALVELGELKAEQNVLVHGGSGGVGAACIQIAKHVGANVYATCSAENMEQVRALGADTVIDYQTSDFRTLCKEIDVAMDPIGGQTNLDTYEVMRPGGTIAVVLREDKLEMENRERLSQQYGVTVKVVAFDLRPDLLDTVRELAEDGRINPNIRHIFPLHEARAAHQILQTTHPGGRIVLKVGSEQ